jgi:putative aldouronate transport system permease protein
VGLANFKELFSDELFWIAVKNMMGLSIVKIVFSIMSPIIFATLINEVRYPLFKKAAQTASYLPHFISWVVTAGIFSLWLDRGGVVNNFLVSAHLIEKPVSFLNSPGSFWLLMAIIDTWKETGWWAIIYLAAMSGISQELYEAAIVDGAGRIRRIVSITLPSIRSTIMVVFTLSVGGMIYGGLTGSNFQQSLLFGNPLNNSSSSILETYILKLGVNLGRFSYAIAAGLLLSVVSLALFSTANHISKKLTETSIY